MTEETLILVNRAYTVVFEFKNIKILLKIGNEVYKLTKKCNIGSWSDKDTLAELWSPDSYNDSECKSRMLREGSYRFSFESRKV